MLLSRMIADPSCFQCRLEPFSLTTVEGIVATGIDLAMFDPIPVIDEHNRFIVAGDGHSRFEAVTRLAALSRLPVEWMDGPDDWDIPTRTVNVTDALRLAYTANMRKSPFSEVEEAIIFQRRLDAGETFEQISESSHRSVGYIRKHLMLNSLSSTIREAVGKPWGIDADKAIVMGEMCQRYQINHQVQQRLWLEVISRGQWTQQSMKLFMEKFGQSFSKRPVSTGEEFLFALPANVSDVVEQMTSMADQRRRAKRGLQWLVQAIDALADFPDLVALLVRDGERMIESVKQAELDDAEALHAVVMA